MSSTQSRFSLRTSKTVSRLAAAIGLISLLAVTGCSSIRVKFGLRVAIAKLPVSSMNIALPNNPGIAPGEQSPLVATFTQPDGKVLVTEGKGKGKVLWRDLMVTPTVVTVNKKGVLSLPHDPRKTDGKMGHVTVTVPSHPDLKAELDIPLRYDFAFSANFNGAAGSNGSDGINGTDGTSGTPGSIDPNNPSAGGNGSSGSNGTAGSNGDPGGDAPNVQVLATLRAGAHPLLQFKVSAPGRKDHFYLVDPQGGTLTINANGGPGGSGGKGGKGGRGGPGGSGIPPGNSGSDGSNGFDGSDGSPGAAGSITVTYDPSVQPYLALIHTSNSGGPKPVFNEAPVAPLW
jgi:hypothetical protein